MDDLMGLLLASNGSPSKRMTTALLLKYLAEMLVEDEDEQPTTESPTHEDGIPVRPHFMPSAGP